MKLRLFHPQIIVYGTNLPPGTIGFTRAFVTRISPFFKDNEAVRAHERAHVM